MKRLFWVIFPVALFFLTVLLGCSRPAPSAVPAGQQPASQGIAAPVSLEAKNNQLGPAVDSQIATKESPVSTQVPVQGAGSFNFIQPDAGLDSLASYSQHYEQRFSGKKNGADFTSSTVITYTFLRQPVEEISAMQTADQDGKPLEIIAAKMGEAGYFKYGPDSACQGMGLTGQVDMGSIPDPASLLPLVYGAEQSGEETLNGVPAIRYTFDELALAVGHGGKASGSVWMAKNGGWVVKYSLEIDAPKDVLGAGLEGKQTWLYEMTDAGTVTGIDLPMDCAPVLLDFPVTPGAQDVERMSGSVHYYSSESVDQISSFYREQLTAQGWKEKEMFASSPEKTVLNFILPEGNQQKISSVLIQPSGNQAEITAVVFVEELPPPATTPTVAP